MPARFPKILLTAAISASLPATAFGQEVTDAPVTVGLDARLRYEVIDPTGFGNGPQDPGGYLLWRAAPDVNVKLSPEWRFHGELFVAGEAGRNGGARANDRNDLDLTQAFIEFRPDSGTFIRAGRQEMALGSGRILAAFDGANVRRRFDGVLAQTQTGPWTFIAMAASPVLVRPGIFDDSSSLDRLAVGVGVIRGEPNRNHVALYGLRTQSFAASFGASAGRQERFTVGARFSRTMPQLFVEGEALAQFGNAESSRRVRAWALAGELRTPILPLGSAQLLAGAKFSVASGDVDRADGRITGFDPLFPNPVFTGSFPIFAPTNMASINPALSVQWPNGNRIGIDVALMQRLTINDQLYALGGAPIPTPGAGRSVGALWALSGNYRINPQLSINGAAVWLNQGRSFLSQQRDTVGAFLNLNLTL
jgi:Alginate export